jgi:hypothetical protein
MRKEKGRNSYVLAKIVFVRAMWNMLVSLLNLIEENRQ